MYLNQPPAPRRRKKRHTHGLRTVEINRGRNGYGFTISGQHPCVLSCIVGGSPADKMGLKMGDLLIAVNNKDVSNASHDDVVRMIGSSRGMLILQIAENFTNASESSDDEFQTRPKSKYPNRVRMRGAVSKQSVDDMAVHGHDKARQRSRKDPLEQARLRALSPGREQERRHQEKYDRYHHDMRSMGIENIDPSTGSLHVASNSNPKRVSSNDGIIRYRSPNTKHTIITREARLGHSKSQSHGEGVRPPPGGASDAPRVSSGYQRESSRRLPPSVPDDDNEEHSVLLGDYLRVIVGYVGTVGMARDSKNDATRMQSIRNAVHRLKVERKMTTMVLMELAGNGVRLINTMGSTVALYAAEHIAFSGIHSEDKRFFGIVTIHIETLEDSRADSEMSDSSCHVFKVNPELCQHNLHVHKVRNFGIHCTVHPDNQQCMEFPRSAVPIMRCMSHLYRERPSALYETEMAQIGAFARPNFVAQRNESNSSNSDSGLGVARDDPQGQPQANANPPSNRVCVVEMSHNNSHPSEASFRWDTDQSGMTTPHGASGSHGYREPDVSPILADNTQNRHGALEHSTMSNVSDTSLHPGVNTMERLNLRAMPDPKIDQDSSANIIRPGASKVQVSHPPQDRDRGDAESNKSNDSNQARSVGKDHSRQRQPSSSSSESHYAQSRLSKGVITTSMSSTRNESIYLDSFSRQTQNSLTISAISSSSVTDSSGSSFDMTPNPTPGSSVWSRPRSYPTCPVPQPPGVPTLSSQQPDRPPIPERQPIIPRKAPKTPLNPPSSRHRGPRPKSTPPFKELHKNTGVEDDQSGYDSEPGSTMEVDECPPLRTSNKPPIGKNKLLGDVRRFSEGYTLSKKVEKSSGEVIKKPGSFRQVTDKPFRRQTLSSSHESLVVTRDDGANNSRLNAATSVTTISNKGVVVTGQTNGSLETVGRAACWAVSFDKLLRDDIGITIFTDFLKKEFSEENIVFWKSCEEFKKTTSPDERKRLAKDLFDKHISAQASEPVNVDSTARQNSQDMLGDAPIHAFDVAQLQISRLMKQDSYVRFLKSEGYKACVVAEMEGKPLPCPDMPKDEANNNQPITAPSTPGEKWRKTLKKSKSSTSTAEEVVGEEKRRRSLLPWSKSKIDKKMAKMSTDPDLRRNGLEHLIHAKGRTSLDLADLNTISKHIKGPLQEVDPKSVTAKESHKFCRVILPDSSTTVVLAISGRSIRQTMCELCERRQMIIELTDVSLAGDDQPLDMSRDLSALASRQIILDKLCLFRLDLPQRRYVCVRAKPSQTLALVFKPILEKYGLILDHNMVVHVAGTGVILNEEQNMSSLEYKQVIVQSLDDFKGKRRKEWGSYGSHRNLSSRPPIARVRGDPYKQAKTLVEIVVQMFKDILDTTANNLEASSIRFDETGSWDVSKFKTDENRGSGILGFIRRNSIGEKEGNKAKAKTAKMFGSVRQNKPPPVVAPQLPLPPPPVPPAGRGRGKRFDADDERLFELLSRAQSRQMDDQRGLTARDFELPDFLRVEKMEETERPQTAGESKPDASPPRTVDTSRPKTAPSSRAQDVPDNKHVGQEMVNSSQQLAQGLMTPRTAKLAMGNESFSEDGVVPTPNRATNYFMDSGSMDETRIMERSLRDLGMTSDLQGPGQSYMGFVSQNPNNDRLSPRANLNQMPNGPQPRPRVPKRRNPPTGQVSESSDSDRSKGRTPTMSSDDDLDITLIPPSDSSCEEVEMLPPQPRLNASTLNHTDQANFSPPTPLGEGMHPAHRPAPVGESLNHPAHRSMHLEGNMHCVTHRADNLPTRALPKHTSYSRMVANHIPQNSISSISSRESDMEIELTGQSGSDHGSRSTPSPTTHDLILDIDSGSECGTSAPQHTVTTTHNNVPSQSTQRHSITTQSKAKKSLFDSRDIQEKVQVSFV